MAWVWFATVLVCAGIIVWQRRMCRDTLKEMTGLFLSLLSTRYMEGLQHGAELAVKDLCRRGIIENGQGKDLLIRIGAKDSEVN